MVSVAPRFPSVETPDGWTREIQGPRVWLVPPTRGGRIVLPPLQGRASWLRPEVFLERVLLQERDRFVGMKQTDLVPVTSAHQASGLVVDVAALDAAGEPTEWRTYALYMTDTLFALMFLQSAPQRFAELRPLFLQLASTVVMPPGEAPESSADSPFEVDL